MISLQFEWEPRKASANLKKHGVSFEEAKSVFLWWKCQAHWRSRSFRGWRAFYLIRFKPFSSSDSGLSLPSKWRQCYSYYFGSQGNAQWVKSLLKVPAMRKEYDFSKARKNPYASMLKKPITIRLDEDSVTYFKAVSQEVGIPYQSLINLYLRDCATSHKKLNLSWK